MAGASQKDGASNSARPRQVCLTDDDRRVIRERYFGWEGAKPDLLAQVFGVSVQVISAVLRQRPPMPTGHEFADGRPLDQDGRNPAGVREPSGRITEGAVGGDPFSALDRAENSTLVHGA